MIEYWYMKSWSGAVLERFWADWAMAQLAENATRKIARRPLNVLLLEAERRTMRGKGFGMVTKDGIWPVLCKARGDILFKGL
ncbi:hypothetical protein D3C86_2153790 [compost metagenome]